MPPGDPNATYEEINNTLERLLQRIWSLHGSLEFGFAKDYQDIDIMKDIAASIQSNADALVILLNELEEAINVNQ